MLRAIVVLGIALTALNGYLTVEVMPRSNRELRELKVRLFSSAKVIGQIEPRVFYEGFPNLLLYVRDIDPETGEWINFEVEKWVGSIDYVSKPNPICEYLG